MICRGCAGTGVSHRLTAREAQIVTIDHSMRRSNDTPAAMNFRVAPVEHRGRLIYEGPLALVLAEIDKRVKEGWWHSDPWEFEKRWLCEWCNGYGDPTGQLTTHALEQAMG